MVVLIEIRNFFDNEWQLGRAVMAPVSGLHPKLYYWFERAWVREYLENKFVRIILI
jgi:hypothetical protein